jgi:hypothetical protein
VNDLAGRCNLSPLGHSGAESLITVTSFEYLGDELGTTLHAEPSVQHGHVLVHRGIAQGQTRRDLLLAIPSSRHASVWRSRGAPPTPLHSADERSANEPAELEVEEGSEAALPRREVPVADRAMNGE